MPNQYKVPPTLADIQENFQDYILSPNYGDFEKIKQKMRGHTDNVYGLDANDRLEIYYDMYRLRLFDVLFADYPKLAAIMAEEKFKQAFLHYLLHYPSRHYSVRPFGANFSSFLSQFDPFCLDPYYSEIAKFEWDLSLTFDAEDKPLGNITALKNLPPEKWVMLRFKLHPSVSLLTFNYNIVPIWQKLDLDLDLDLDNQKTVNLITALPNAQTWLIWRKNLKAHFQALNSEQYLMLEAIHQDLCFSEVCETLGTLMPSETIPGFAAAHLSTWLESGVLY